MALIARGTTAGDLEGTLDRASIALEQVQVWNHFSLCSGSLVLGGKHDGPLCLPPPWGPLGDCVDRRVQTKPPPLFTFLYPCRIYSPTSFAENHSLVVCRLSLFFRCFSRATRPVVLSWVLAGGASVSCLAWVPFPCSKPPAIHQAIKSINQRPASCWLSPYSYIHSYTRIHTHTQAYTSSSIQPPHRPSSLVVR